MKRKLFVSLLFLAVGTILFGQKKMEVSVYDLGSAVPREAGDNETVVIVKTPLTLTFESTMDKMVDVYDTKEESGFKLYYLKFSTLPKYKGRKLKIKSDTYETNTYPLELTAKVPLGLYVVDPDGLVGHGCYKTNRNAGNELFVACRYDDAIVKYREAIECSDLEEDNDLSIKIEDAGNCADYKRNADNWYNNNEWEKAKRDYEKVLALNLQDEHCRSRIDLCDKYIGELPRTITGIVTDQDGKPMEGVNISAQYEKVDKKGRVKMKNGVPETEYKSVGKTDAQGRYSIVVLNKSKYLTFVKGYRVGDTMYKAEVEIVNDVMDVALTQKVTTGDVTDVVNEGAKAVNEILKIFK